MRSRLVPCIARTGPSAVAVLLLASLELTGCIRCPEGSVRRGDGCATPCNASSDCPSDQVCVDGVCEAGTRGVGGGSSRTAASSTGPRASSLAQASRASSTTVVTTSSVAPSSSAPASSAAVEASSAVPSSSSPAASAASSSAAGVPSSSSAAAPSSSGECCQPATGCAALVDSVACAGGGCAWQPPSCAGTPAACSTHTDTTSCTAAGCTWDAAGPCGGTHPGCNTYTDENDCGLHGCTPETVCTGTHLPCSSFATSDSFTCRSTHGCDYTFNACTGTHRVCNAYNFSDRCDNHGCTWDFGAGRCTGTAHTCADDNPPGVSAVLCEEGGCTADVTCATPAPWNHACTNHRFSEDCIASGCSTGAFTCTGTPHGCQSDPDTRCTGTCTWDPARCTGAPTACAALSSTTCAATSGCSWQGGCSAATTCGGRARNTCLGGGCTWTCP